MKDRIAELENEVRVRDELLAITAHELRNPMHALLLQITVALAKARRGSDADLVQRLERTKYLMDRFVKRASVLLDASRVGADRAPLNLETVDLDEVVRDITDSYLPEAQFHRVGAIEISSTGSCIGRWDRSGIEQIVANLVSNAIKYGAGAPVSIDLGRTEEPPGARLQVRDRGIGIAPEDQPRIFGRFEQVLSGERRREGFGLGLWLVQRLVDAHQGTVSLSSTVGEGSTFTVWLPIDPSC